MNSEDRLYKQLEAISTTVIKALESFEKELSEYIEITDERLQTLEKKVNKMEAYMDVSNKGLIKAMENSSSEKTKHATQQPPAIKTEVSEIPQQKEAIQTNKQVSEKPEQPMTDRPPRPQTKSFSIPKPPKFEASLKKEQKTSESPKQESKILENQEQKKEKTGKEKEDPDKEELMSALKLIDSL